MLAVNDAGKMITAGMTNAAANGQRTNAALVHINGSFPDHVRPEGHARAWIGRFDISIKQTIAHAQLTSASFEQFLIDPRGSVRQAA